ncbi:MAG: hypothetical protein ACLUI3_01180 [Christensenellales bacterium]
MLLTAALALCALTMTAQNEASDNIMLQTVTLVREPLLRSLLLSLAALAALLGMHGLLERLGGVRLGAGLCALWLAAALLWIWAIGMRQRADAQMVLADAHQFARNHYDALSGDYLQVYTYQLGIALPLHMLARLFSGATMEKLNVLAQCVNAALGIAGAGVLAALAQELLDLRAASATLLLYIASLPTLLFAQFVYNINLMILLARARALLCALCAHGARRVRACVCGAGGAGDGRQAERGNCAAGAAHLRAAARVGEPGHENRAACGAVLRDWERGVRGCRGMVWETGRGRFPRQCQHAGAAGDGDAGIPHRGGMVQQIYRAVFCGGCDGAAGKGAGACGNRRAARLDAGKSGGGAGVLPGEAADPVARTGLRHAVVGS